MSKSLLYAVNSQSQTVPVNGVISFGNPIRRFGSNTSISNGNAEVKGCGYYDIDTNITFTAGATGNSVITFYLDGVAIAGANTNITVASGDEYQVSIPFAVREMCGKMSTITAVVTGVTITVLNSAIKVVKS